MRITIYILIILAFVYCGMFAYSRAGLDNGYSIIEHKFICYDKSGNLYQANDMALSEGGGYGWTCLVKTTTDKIDWSETLTLPVRPDIWPDDPSVVVSEDGKTAIKSGSDLTYADVLNGFIDKITFVRTAAIHNSWSIVDGDPIGDYIVNVKIGNDSFNRIITITK